MKRFLKMAVLLVISLFVLVSGVDATLDHLSHSMDQNYVTVYNDKGEAVLVYSGDLNFSHSYSKVGQVVATPSLLHRT